jgi:hypothetical protein
LTTLVEGNILAFKRYKEILEDKKVTPKDQSADDNPLTLSHALWMCNYSLDYYKKYPYSYPLDKFSRWLGFVQAMRAAGDNRPVYCVKWAAGGTALEVGWRPGSGTHWNTLVTRRAAARATSNSTEPSPTPASRWAA